MEEENVTEENTTEAISEATPHSKKDKKKGKKGFDPLADKEIKFKKVDFEHALTPEEKAAKKAAKAAAKKGKKPPKEKKPPPLSSENDGEVTEEQTETSEKKVDTKSASKENIEEGKKEKLKEVKETKKEKKEKEVKGEKKDAKKKDESEAKEKKSKKKDKQDTKETKAKEKHDKTKSKEETIEDEIKDETKEKKTSKEEVGEETKLSKLKKSKSGLEGEGDKAQDEESKGKKKGKKGKGKKEKKISIEEEVIVEEEKKIPVTKVPSEDEWSWYSCSCSEGEVEEEEEEETKVKKDKKAKKEKKDKKKKKELEEELKPVEVEAPPAEDDFLAEIKKLQAAALSTEPTEQEVAEAPPPPKKKKPKPKKEKKQKPVKMTAAMIKQMEEEAKRLALEEKIRLEQERLAAIAAEKKKDVEHILRMEQLEHSVELRRQIQQNYVNLFVDDKEQAEWDHFLRCDGLPYPLNVPQMNTYIDLWGTYMKSTNIPIATERTESVLKILEFLTEYIEFPIDTTPQQLKDWKWILHQLREKQQENMNQLTCFILRNIAKRMKREIASVATFSLKTEYFTQSLYALPLVPKPLPNPRKPPRKRLEVDFPDVNLNVLFPEALDCYLLAIRVMYLKYDHLTDTSATFTEPEPPQLYQKDLKETTFSEYYQKQYYKYVNRVIVPPKPLEEGEEPPPEPEVDVEKGIIPSVPYQKLEPSPSEYFVSIEDDTYQDALSDLELNLAPDVINLRRFVVYGGLFYLNLFQQPPQPKELPNLEIIVTVLTNPECLRVFPFYVRYVPPPPPGPGVIRSPEEIEEEMKRLEKEMDELIYVTMDLPSHVLWLDPPTVCTWDYSEKQWTTKDIHDVKYNEEKVSIAFRTGRFGTFGLAVNKYCNLPYQTWEIKPEKDGSVSLQITAAIAFIEFNVNGKLICMSKLQNTPTKAMREHLGVYYKLTKLMRVGNVGYGSFPILKEGGIDVFPGHDAFLYVEGGHCRKHWPTEQHLYYNMAEIAGCFNMSWSRWNMSGARRNIIFQIREYDVEKTKQVPYSLVLVNPLNAIYIDCTEVSPTLNLEPVEGMKFYSDLFFLIRGSSRMAIRTKVQNTPLDLVGSLAELLTATRVLSWA